MQSGIRPLDSEIRRGIKPDAVELSLAGIKNFPPLVGGIKGGGENSNNVLNFYFATLSQPLPSRERSYLVLRITGVNNFGFYVLLMDRG